MRFNQKVWRWRRPPVPNPRNPDETRLGSWADSEVVEIEGAAVLSTSQYAVQTETRLQALTSKSLFLDDPHADVRRLDGISTKPGGSEPEFIVEVVPVADVNPFTGWQPALEVPLKGVHG